jgi:hypothetical protein
MRNNALVPVVDAKIFCVNVASDEVTVAQDWNTVLGN